MLFVMGTWPAYAGAAVSSSHQSVLPARAATRVSLLVVAWMLFTVASSQTLPYTPTTILYAGTGIGANASNQSAYIFTPNGNSVDLLSLDVSSTIQSSSFTPQTISKSVPFAGTNQFFAPSLLQNGTIVVFAGNCSTSNGSAVWTFNPASGSGGSNWVRLNTTSSNVAGSQQNPGFLGASFSFSTTLAPSISQPNTYVYGGMCPSSSTGGTTSQSQATYSNQMIKLSNSKATPSNYNLQYLTNSGAPIAEAGFSFTGLWPSITNRSGTVTQQVNYVQLGGHTQTAFINMSTVAIWSLPEESWGFLTQVEVAGSGSPGTELAIKSTSQTIDSRSGHTAILNEEGTAMIIYGGWVGDLSQAASPQLVVLEVGAGYGGNGSWQWSIPDKQPSGSGQYGHAAVLLPGNVMMVYGGYSISGSSKSRRQTSGSPSFLNLTSMAWTDSYTNPSYKPASSSTSSTSGDASNSQKQRLGLGLGLGLGLAAALAAVVLYCCYRRRQRTVVQPRETAIRAMAQDPSRFLGHDEMIEQEDAPGMYPSWYAGGHDPYSSGGRSLGYEALRHDHDPFIAGGRSLGYEAMRNDHINSEYHGDLDQLSYNRPSGRINRKPVAPRAARGSYQPAPLVIDTSTGPRAGYAAPGVIHPIYEADEDGEDHDREGVASPVRESNRDSAQYSDPFATPTHDGPLSLPPPSRTSRTPSPEMNRRSVGTDPEVQDWMTDVDAADALLTSRMSNARTGPGGRVSPTRRATVRSNRSTGGTVADDESRTGSNVSETNRNLLTHLRSGFGLPAATVAATMAAEGRSGTSSSSSSAPSWNTAKSSFPTLQAEGPSLLLGRPGNTETPDTDETPGSPSKMKPRRGWLGSLRRVFSVQTPTSSPSDSAREHSPMFGEMAEGDASDYDARIGGLGTIAAGGLLRRKGGRGAWEVQEGAEGAERREADTKAYDEEWDIEKAVESRLVQVLFTVPKERLRVVNAEPDVESAKDVVVVDPDESSRPRSEQVEVHVLEPEEDEQSFSHSRMEDKKRGKQVAHEHSVAGHDMAEHDITEHDTAEQDIAEHDLTEHVLAEHDDSMHLDPGIDYDRRLSGAESFRDDHSAELFSAEAVTFERPKTKVLAMVESIESRSRSNSPKRP